MDSGTTDADAKPRFLLVWPDGGFFSGSGGGGGGRTHPDVSPEKVPSHEVETGSEELITDRTMTPNFLRCPVFN